MPVSMTAPLIVEPVVVDHASSALIFVMPHGSVSSGCVGVPPLLPRPASEITSPRSPPSSSRMWTSAAIAEAAKATGTDAIKSDRTSAADDRRVVFMKQNPQGLGRENSAAYQRFRAA